MPDAFDRFIAHLAGMSRARATESKWFVEQLAADVWGALFPGIRWRLDRIPRRGSLAEVSGTATYRGLLGHVPRAFRSRARRVRSTLIGRLEALVRHEEAFTIKVLGEEFGLGNLGPIFSRAQIRRILLREPAAGLTLGQWLDGMEAKAAVDVMTEVNGGLVEGLSTSRIMRRVGELPVRRSLDAAEAAVESGAVQAASRARSEVADRAPLVDGRSMFVEEWSVYLEGNPCPRCLALQGERFEKGEGPVPPLHPRCQCDRIPVPRRSAKNPETGMAWLRKQSVERQNDVLGPSRARAWRGRRLSLRSMTDKDNRLLTLEELREREGIKV
jgi:hypothetical protein